MRSAVVLALLVAPVGLAEAHIHLLQPMSRQTDAQGDPQKEQHCGSPTLTRTPARTTNYLPGQTVMVMWSETINHPGWFRISFQPNGDVFRIPPASNGDRTDAMGNPQPSNFPTEDLTGMTDPDGTGSLILKDRIPDGMSSFEITLPTTECTNCTLQFIQVMTNSASYSTDALSDDIYFNCADIVISASAPDAGPTATDVDAGVDPGGGGPRSGTETGGCSAGGGAGWPAMLALLGLVGWRRRRR